LHDIIFFKKIKPFTTIIILIFVILYKLPTVY